MKAHTHARVLCTSVVAFSLDDRPAPFVGDNYGDGFPGHIVDIAEGTHSFEVRLRFKHRGRFRCTLETQGDNKPLIVGGKRLTAPEVIDGVLPSDLVSVLVANGHPTAWLRNVKLEIKGGSVQLADMQPPWPALAPAQHALVQFRVKLTQKGCPEKVSQLSVTGELESGQIVQSAQMALSLKCRKQGQSFVFTFHDDDGSVQHAAAVAPAADAQCAKECPVLLTLHGTTITASDSADSYKVKSPKDADYRFGVENGWLLAPTRGGAHNWEGPGRVTALAALRVLPAVADTIGGIPVDVSRVIFAGHSMGGHGAWLLAIAEPGKALCVVSSASWLRKDQYSDSNKVFMHDVATSGVDPALAGLLRAAEEEFNTDSHTGTIASIPALARVGDKDATVPPWYSRRMVRGLLADGAANVTLTEVPGKEHWWWDTKVPNDGGVVNDEQMRHFFKGCFAQPRLLPKSWRLVLYNPATTSSKGGLRVLQQLIPHRRTELSVETTESSIKISTGNVRRFQWASTRVTEEWGLRGSEVAIIIDGQPYTVPLSNKGNTIDTSWCQAGRWQQCADGKTYDVVQRSPTMYGPIRQVFAAPFCGIIGSNDQVAMEGMLYLANLLVMTGLTHMPIFLDKEVMSGNSLKPPTFCKNLVVLGNPSMNSATEALLQSKPELNYTPPLGVSRHAVTVGGCAFPGSETAVLALLPWWTATDQPPGVALLVASPADAEPGGSIAVQALALLATPTIPPMTRPSY